MVLVHYLLSTENERTFVYSFFEAAIAENLFDKRDLFENDEKFLLTDITRHNRQRRKSN